MKTKILLLLTIVVVGYSSGYSQLNQQKRKKFREERKLELRQKVNQLIDSKNFMFVAKTAFPLGGSAIDLTTSNNAVKFSPDKIYSYMPFFGQAYNIDYRGDPGFKFDKKPETFDIKELKNGKGYDVQAKVSLPRDNVKLSLQVGPEGTSTLTILSDQRNSISYFGYITDMD